MLDLLRSLATIAALASLVALIRPLPKIHLPTRKRAAIVFVTAIFISGGLQEATQDETNPTSRKTNPSQTQRPETANPKPRPKPEPRTQTEPEPKKITPTNITFEQVDKLFGTGSQLTDLQKEEYWKKYEGQCIQWTGTLKALDEGFFDMKIGMEHKTDPFNLDLGQLEKHSYDVKVTAPKSLKEKLIEWRVGHKYTYQGTLKNMPTMLSHLEVEWGCQ